MKSRVEKFHLYELNKRQSWMRNFANLTEEELSLYQNFGSVGEELSDQLIENTVGVLEIPLGLGMNFIVNGNEVVVPMAVEESSVVAAASHGAKLTRKMGGFKTTVDESVMFSQIQVVNCKDPFGAMYRVLEQKEEVLKLANDQDPTLVNLGGGAFEIEARVIGQKENKMLILHLLVNTLDAMGANAVNTMAEKVSPLIEQITGGEVYLRIISNFADKRIARARCTIHKDDIGGEEVVDRILMAYEFASIDPYRAATHNKGIMNGISSVILATGNDTRAIEAGAHVYASRNGQYTALTKWEKNCDGHLVGTLELPLAVGIIGGATALHPKAKTNLKIMNVKTARELSEITVSVGLAQNLTALKALATDGVQKGHMKLHAKNIAIMAGASSAQVDFVAKELVSQGKVRLDFAKEVLSKINETK